jgi:hypothetical protein
MVWSLHNLLHTKQVSDLLDAATEGNEARVNFTPALDREKAEQIIHAVIWAACCRSSDFAAAYAFDALYHALGDDTVRWLHDRMEFEKRTTQSAAQGGDK